MRRTIEGLRPSLTGFGPCLSRVRLRAVLLYRWLGPCPSFTGLRTLSVGSGPCLFCAAYRDPTGKDGVYEKSMNELIEKIERREARLAVIGMGYVGLPLAVEFASEGLRPWGST